MKTWKQPIPTNLERYFGNDYEMIQLFKELIYRSCHNKAMPWEFSGRTVLLKKGQVIFGRTRYGEYLCWSPSKVERVFQKLRQFSDMSPDINLDISRTPAYTVVTIKNYDDWTNMDTKPDTKPDRNRTGTGQEPDTSENVKNVNNINKQSKGNVISESSRPMSRSERGLPSRSLAAIRYARAHPELKMAEVDAIFDGKKE